MNMRILLLALSALATTSCGPKCPDSPPEDCISEGNWKREDADSIAVKGTTPSGVEYDLLTSSVNFDERDATDWVTLKVPGEGTLTVEYNWDNIKCKCSIVITDELGYKLDSVSNKGKRSSISVPTKVGGQYFVRFKADVEGMRSVYSAKFTWERAVAVAPPPPATAVAPSTAAPPDRPKPPPGTGRVKPPPPPPPDEDLGKIVKVIPGTESGDPTVITINRGSGDGIKVGMTGYLADLPSAKFKVKTVYGGSCEATVKGAAPEKVRGKVVFNK